MGKRKNFYAVVRGRRTGLFTKWAGENGAQEQVHGFSNAKYEGFYKLKEAKKWFEREYKIERKKLERKWAKEEKELQRKIDPYPTKITEGIATESYQGDIPPWDESLGDFQFMNIEDAIEYEKEFGEFHWHKEDDITPEEQHIRDILNN